MNTNTVPKLTMEQAEIVTAFTGRLLCPIDRYQAYVERKLGRPVMTHEFGDKETMNEIREASRADFVALLPEGLGEPC